VLVLQIHDELIFEVPSETLNETATEVKRIMENAIRLRVPLKTELSYGPNLADMTSL